jgi:CHAT domain-containing protein
MPDRLAEAGTYVVMGTIYHSLGEEERALDCLNHGSRFLGGRSIPGWTSYIYEQIGAVYESLKQDQKALDYYERALALSRLNKNPRTEVSILNRIGRLRRSLGEEQVALRCFNDALTLARAIRDRFSEAATLYNLAHLQRRLEHWDEAREEIEAAIRTVELLRSNVKSHDLRTSYFASMRQSYELNIDILMQLHKRRTSAGFDAKAFDLSEKARARSFLESLKEARANIEQDANPELSKKERELEQTLNVKAERHMHLISSMQTNEAEAVAKEIDQITTAYDAVRAQIRSQSPRYAALTQPQPLTLTEIQQRLLDDNTLLLEYLLGDERSYVWAVTRTEISSYELPGRGQIEDSARRLYTLLSALQPKPGETFQQRQARAQQARAQLPSETSTLSKLLLGPLADKLGTKRLLIVPDGALQYIPFQPLTVAANKNPNEFVASAGPDEQIPLVLNHEIVNEPSASALALVLSESTNRKSALKSVAILADPVFDMADSRIESPNAGSLQAVSSTPTGEITRALRDVGVDGGEIPRLISSREEAQAIMSVVPWRTGFKAIDFDANRTTAMGSDLGQYRVVHFATHALLDNEHPELSGIVLSLVDQKGQRQDGFLRLHDIYNLKLPVDLVVLSACQTGLGKDVRGEGLIGLTRGFMYAGASGVVASLWKVDDEATAELMKYFYEGLFEKGLSPSGALREAQLALRQQKRWREPYYWAGFVIQGQYANQGGNSYQITPAVKLAVLGVAVGLSFSMILVLWRRRRRNL